MENIKNIILKYCILALIILSIVTPFVIYSIKVDNFMKYKIETLVK